MAWCTMAKAMIGSFSPATRAMRPSPMTGASVRPDVFPSTQRTWIRGALGQSGEEHHEVNRHIMSVYAHPLRVYFRGTSLHWLGDPDDVVAGFFADRLARGDFLEKWQESGLRLRRWLMNAFSFHLNELRRKRRRDHKTAGGLPDVGSEDIRPEQALDRAFGQSIVAEALRLAQEDCAAKKLHAHWAIFMRHFYDGLPYEAIAPAFEVSVARSHVMARTAARHFRTALRNLLLCDGATEREMEDEIRGLLEVLES